MSMKILIAYDGSDFAKAAIDDLRRAGLRSDVEATVLTVANVWPPVVGDKKDPAARESAATPLLKMRDTLVEQAVIEANALSQEGAQRTETLFPTWKVIPAISHGSPYAELIKRAAESNQDLIVVGPRGRSAAAKALEWMLVGLGSVTHQVLRFAPCSVRVGRHDVARGDRPVRVIVGVDFSKESATALQAISMRKWPVGTQVKVITVLDMPMLTALPAIASAWNDPRQEDAATWARRIVDQCADELRESGVDAIGSVLEGDPKDALLRDAYEWGADCIFVGAHGQSRLERFMLGSVSAPVAERASCSVEVVRYGSRSA